MKSGFYLCIFQYSFLSFLYVCHKCQHRLSTCTHYICSFCCYVRSSRKGHLLAITVKTSQRYPYPCLFVSWQGPVSSACIWNCKSHAMLSAHPSCNHHVEFLVFVVQKHPRGPGIENILFQKLFLWQITMPAKSLGTLAIIYAVHVLQHPLAPHTMCATEILIILYIQVIHFYIAMDFRPGSNVALPMHRT